MNNQIVCGICHQLLYCIAENCTGCDLCILPPYYSCNYNDCAIHFNIINKYKWSSIVKKISNSQKLTFSSS